MQGQTAPATVRRSVWLIPVMLLVLDQLTKLLVRSTMVICSGPPVELCDRLGLGPVGILRIENRGGAFGLDPGEPIWLPLTGACVLAGILLVRVPRSRRGAVAVGLLIAGAAGNALDRLIFGRVTDFIDPGGLVIFNVADIVLAIGSAILSATLAGVRASVPFRRRVMLASNACRSGSPSSDRWR